MPGFLEPREVADYLIAYTDAEAGDTISSLKLQKLIYYAQGFCLGMRGEALFNEAIQAWDHGPIVRSVYNEHKHKAAKALDTPGDFDPDRYAPEDRELLDAILETYGQLSASRLRNLTHSEPPWRDAYRAGENVPITVDAMRPFFEGLVESGRRGEPIPGRPDWASASFLHQRRRQLDARMDPHRERLRAMIHARGGPGPMWSDDDED